MLGMTARQLLNVDTRNSCRNAEQPICPKKTPRPLAACATSFPLDVLRRNYVIDVVERVYQSYGFEPLETPTMERLSTLLGKYGEDEKLIFRVMKRGEKLTAALGDHPTEDSVGDAGMRYDLTVPLARVVAEYRNDLPAVFKRYQIQPVYRADRPGRGRYREFYQCDVDVVGSTSEIVEAEVLNAGAQVMRELGFGGEQPFAIRLNHRGILRGLMEAAGVPPALEDSALVAIDKLDKIGMDGVRAELGDRGVDANSAERLLETMTDAPHDNEAMLAWLERLLIESEQGAAGVESVRKILELLPVRTRCRPPARRPLPGPWPELLHRPHLRSRVARLRHLRRRRWTL